MDNQTYPSYGRFAKFLHWSVALLVVLNYFIGSLFKDTGLFFIHIQLGLLILLLMLIRIMWRLSADYPKAETSLSRFNQILAASGHGLLYVALLMVPIAGILLVNAKGYQITVLGLFQLPTTVNEMDKASSLRHAIKFIHVNGANFIFYFGIVHALVALKHHHIGKNTVLLRMLPEFVKKIVK